MLVNPFTGRQFVAPQHLCQRECKYRNILKLQRVDFIKILRKQLIFPVELTNLYPFHTPILYPQTPRWRRLHGIKKGSAPAARALILIRYPHTNSIYSYSRLRKARIQGALRPVVVTRPTSTTSRGDQYWSQSPSSEGRRSAVREKRI